MTKSNTRREILQAAINEFIKQGYAGARLQSVADNTGVTKAMIHYYFDTKENLFREAYRLVCEGLISDIFKALEKEDSLFQKIEALIDEVLNRFGKRPKQAEFTISELNHHSEITQKIFAESHQYNFSTLNEQLKAAAENYEIAPVTGEHLVANILSLCIFSFTGREFLQVIVQKKDSEFEAFLDQRREVIKDTIINWLAG